MLNYAILDWLGFLMISLLDLRPLCKRAHYDIRHQSYWVEIIKWGPLQKVMYLLLRALVYGWVGCQMRARCASSRLFPTDPFWLGAHGCKYDYAVIMAISRGEHPWNWGDTPLERILASCCCLSGSDRPSMSDVVAFLSAPRLYWPYFSFKLLSGPALPWDIGNMSVSDFWTIGLIYADGGQSL